MFMPKNKRTQKMPDKHMMVDLETMDTKETAAILTIGAVMFDPRGSDSEASMQAKLDNGEGFSIRCSLESNMAIGRTISARTIMWWLEQSEAARKDLIHAQQSPLGLALGNFRRWISGQKPKATRVWAKDPDFDCKILESAMEVTHEIWPFHFADNRSVRTIMDLAFPDGDCPHIGEGVAHNAFDDAVRQALTVQLCHRTLKS
jgi:hypothetical protein